MTIDNDMNDDELARMHKAKLLHMRETLMSGFAHTLNGIVDNQDLDRMMFIANLLRYLSMGFIFEGQQINDQLDNLNEINLDNLEF